MADPFTDLVIGEIVGGIVTALEPEVVNLVRQALGLPPAATPAVESEPRIIQDTVVRVYDIVNAPEDGVWAIASDVRAMAHDIANLAGSVATLSTAVANLSTAPSAGSIARQVWEYSLGDGEATFNMLSWLERLGANIETYAALPLRGNPLFTIEGNWKHPSD
jgi:hypothetical protein